MSSSKPTQPVNGYTPDRIYHDWITYQHIFDEYQWILDTYDGQILSTSDVSPDPSDGDIALPVAPYHEHETPGNNVVRPEQDTRHIGSMGGFGGAIELGELVPLANNTTVAVEDGLLSVDPSSVTYMNVDIPSGTPLLAYHHRNVSQLRPHERPDVSLTAELPSPPVTFIDPDTVDETNETDARVPTDTTTTTGSVVDPATPAKQSPSLSSVEAYTNPIEPDTLHTGDAHDILQRVRPESVQLAVFSPPYNIGKQYGDYNDTSPINDWYNMMDDVFDQLFRVLKPDGKIVVNIGKSFSDSDTAGRFFFYPLAAYVKRIAIETGFDFWDEAIWEKRGFQSRGGGALMGSYPDPTNFMITQTHEHVLVFRKWVSDSYFNTRTRPPAESDQRVESKLSKTRWRDITQSIWEIDPVRQQQRDVEHNAIFPEELPKRAIQMYSFKDDTVLDPFIGTGTTAVAAKRAGRHYIGVDQNNEYIEHARDRVENTIFDEPGYTDTRSP